jgi:hypothetical protein
MRKGVEIRTLQMKLERAGLHAVRVLTMGGNLVLLSRGPEAEIGLPACNINWWDSFLEDLKPCSPNQVCSTRCLCVRMFGIPLHAWGEKTFKNISSICGEFIGLD